MRNISFDDLKTVSKLKKYWISHLHVSCTLSTTLAVLPFTCWQEGTRATYYSIGSIYIS